MNASLQLPEKGAVVVSEYIYIFNWNQRWSWCIATCERVGCDAADLRARCAPWYCRFAWLSYASKLSPGLSPSPYCTWWSILTCWKYVCKWKQQYAVQHFISTHDPWSGFQNKLLHPFLPPLWFLHILLSLFSMIYVWHHDTLQRAVFARSWQYLTLGSCLQLTFINQPTATWEIG